MASIYDTDISRSALPRTTSEEVAKWIFAMMQGGCLCWHDFLIQPSCEAMACTLSIHGCALQLNTLLQATAGNRQDVTLSLSDSLSGEASRIVVAGEERDTFSWG